MADTGPEKNAHSQSSQRQGFFYQIQIVIGAAFVLATLFTLWTPGVSFDTTQPDGLNFGPPPDLISEQSSAGPSEIEDEIRIGIVAGHWGNDSGAVCSDGLTEAEVNLEIASLVQKNLADRGYKVDLLKEFVGSDAMGVREEPMPAIVFHGDKDKIVHPRNSEGIASSLKRSASCTDVRRERVNNGRAYTCTRHLDQNGRPVLECWTVHGAGHAWSGGHPAGSYTDPDGPDATKEMLRFFREHVLPSDRKIEDDWSR